MRFKVFKTQCKNCLLSANAIVSPERRKEILQDIARTQGFFVCHKSSMQGGEVCCKKFYDELRHQSQMIRIAERLQMVEEVEQEDNEKLTSYNEIKQACS